MRTARKPMRTIVGDRQRAVVTGRGDHMDESDRSSIIDLAVRYTWALDTKNVEDLRNVFTPDATGDVARRRM